MKKKCPNCKVTFSYHMENELIHKNIHSERYVSLDEYMPYHKYNGHKIETTNCPECHQLIIVLTEGDINVDINDDINFISTGNGAIIFPEDEDKNNNFYGVPENYIQEFYEAYEVLTISPKSSAALSRRLLQRIIRNEVQIKKKNLFLEIEAFINETDAPSYLKRSIDIVRKLGNIAAHPISTENAGMIVDVEPFEAEWSLEVIKLMYDFVFTQPLVIEEKRKSVSKKLENIDNGIFL